MFSQFDNEEMENYFNGLNAQLKRMPAADRAEAHQELRQHLDALIAAHEELGATPRKRPKRHSDSLATRSRRAGSCSGSGSFRAAAAASLPILEIICASGLLFALYLGVLNLQAQSNIPIWVRGLWIYLCPPLIAGSVFGLFRPSNALRNAAQASLALSGTVIVLSLPALSRDLACVGSQLAYGLPNSAPCIYWMGQWADDAVLAIQTLASILGGLLPGGCAAYLISSWRRGGFYPVRRTDLKVWSRR